MQRTHTFFFLFFFFGHVIGADGAVAQEGAQGFPGLAAVMGGMYAPAILLTLCITLFFECYFPPP